jgi:hypothetical protein
MYYSANKFVVFVAGTLILILTISRYYYSDDKPLILRWYTGIVCCLGMYERQI